MGSYNQGYEDGRMAGSTYSEPTPPNPLLVLAGKAIFTAFLLSLKYSSSLFLALLLLDKTGWIKNYGPWGKVGLFLFTAFAFECLIITVLYLLRQYKARPLFSLAVIVFYYLVVPLFCMQALAEASLRPRLDGKGGTDNYLMWSWIIAVICAAASFFGFLGKYGTPGKADQPKARFPF